MNPPRSNASPPDPPARAASRTHLSVAHSLTRSILAPGTWQRTGFLLGPFVGAFVLLLVGWWANRSVEQAVKSNLSSQLQAVLKADVAALHFWLDERRHQASAAAKMMTVRETVAALVETAEQTDPNQRAAALLTDPALPELREQLSAFLHSDKAEDFAVVGAGGIILARSEDTAIGDANIAKPFESKIAEVMAGKTIILPPFPSILPQLDADGVVRTGVPVMFVVSPIRDLEDRVVAVLLMKLDPEKEFTEILQVARAGDSGEAYAFNSDGVMITSSRFDDQLKQIGMLTDNEHTRSILNVQLRDPGVDLTAGRRSQLRRADQPLTRMAASALSGESGVDVDGYRDYRGVRVVGAWTWIERDQIGIATEVDAAEAFRPLATLRFAFGSLVALLMLVSIGVCVLAYYSSILQRRARRAALEARRLGQYALDNELGSGGMGVVYRAHHDMLNRPTAVKLLHVDKSDDASIARFEREVQLTSQLTHPNTIAIYDYGRTPEGVFFYAMELLDGMSLNEVINRFGPMDEGRVIFILCQLCGSLTEAHSQGLIHRDIKPANIMLTRYGGMYDFVKLLDFGLVRPQKAEREVTMAGSITGTPLYMSPEAIQHRELDNRSDLYAVGAVAYFLITGQPVFDSEGVLDICRDHVQTDPVPPSKRSGREIDPGLEKVILRCLAKSPDDRPLNAEVLQQELERCDAAGTWSRQDAKGWWGDHVENSPPSDPPERGESQINLAETMASDETTDWTASDD